MAAAQDANCSRQQGVKRISPAFDGQSPIRNVNMCTLSKRVYAGIGASRTVNSEILAANCAKRALELVLNCVVMFLALPTTKRCAIIGDN
jgi:hypothetical protein